MGEQRRKPTRNQINQAFALFAPDKKRNIHGDERQAAKKDCLDRASRAYDRASGEAATSERARSLMYMFHYRVLQADHIDLMGDDSYCNDCNEGLLLQPGDRRIACLEHVDFLLKYNAEQLVAGDFDE